MKVLRPHSLNPVNGRKEWHEFDALLRGKVRLSEQKDILPFFRMRKDLSMLICNYFPKIKNPDRIAHEYEIGGDFVADLVVGDATAHSYLLVEFEEGTPDSIFKRKGKKATPDWAPRLESAYSQLIDWLWKLEDMRSTGNFQNKFGSRNASFQGLIVIGKDMNLESQENERLQWRMEKVMVDSKAINYVSFNELCADMDHWLAGYYKT